ncbi:MAG: S41 family peptidase [Dehalococcoidales bacterium]|jgi:carboxyl-terminal processing protease
MFNSSKTIASMVLIIVIVLAFGGGFLVGQGNPPPSPEGLNVIEEALNDVIAKYVEPGKIVTANITAGAIKGILASLHDPYTAYYAPAEYEMVQSDFEGSFEGIGAVVSTLEGKIIIVAPIAGAPAEKAGIKKNDVILAVNGESTEGQTQDMVVSKIRGTSGTTVELLILHEGETEPVTISVTRAKVEVPSVSFEMRGDIAVISILQFTNRTEEEFAKIMPNLAAENAAGIVLDLRGNPGGILDIVVQVASHFITDGVIVSVRSREGDIEVHHAVSQKVTTALPMVVLVDEFSASGSEVLTGALQDRGRAMVAGNVTYGKGSVNTLLHLSDGSGIYITIARWLTPNGTLIEGNGIIPDRLLDITGEEELQWAIDYLHGMNH